MGAWQWFVVVKVVVLACAWFHDRAIELETDYENGEL